jgi:type IV pilus assembly protein PilY1
VDNSTGTAITSPSTYQYTPKAPYKDGVSNTLADVAMKYWVTDLQPALANEVPTTPNDPAFWQHMTTFTVGLGWSPVGITPSSLTIPQIFSWANTGTPPAGVTTMTWPTPASNSINNIADLAHAAVNGHGNFFSVKNPNDFINGIGSALAAIADRQGAGNAITQSGTTLPTVSSASDPLFQFRATYYTGQWTGALTAATYNTATTPPSYTLAWSTNTWSPTFTTVSGLTLSDRNVWTTKDGTKANGVRFQKASDLSATEQAGLAAYSGTPAQTMLNYLLGDKTYEIGSVGGTLRARKAVLGDVVSSTPVYVAKPDKTLFENATFPGASTYQAFVSSNATRTPIVYTAANDGMLHAFRVTSGAGYNTSGAAVSSQAAGTEVYAYMPAAVLTQTGAGSITNLANPQYGVVNAVDGTQAVPHQYYNDGRITVQNVYFSSDNAWHTVLVGTTGRGPAKAIYALDITDPAVLMNPTTAKNALLWERSAGDGKTGSNYIGEMTGTPVIAQIKQDGATTPSWAVFVGNGYNSAANTAALLQFNLQTGALTVHTTSSTANNGLAEPGLMQGDTNTGISTYAFGGDLFGNLWKFDLTTSTSTGTSVFVAKDALGAPQSITSLTSLIYDSATNSTFALFGTGQYLSNADISNTQKQTWYGLRVGLGADLSGPVNTATPVVTNATTRTSLTTRYAVDVGVNRATSPQVAGDMANKAGWYMDLPQTGERIVNRTQFIAGKAVVTTLIPKVSDPCNTIPAGAVMGVDPFTGANQTTDYGLGTTTITYTNSAGQTVTAPVAINGQVFASGPAGGITAMYTADGKVTITFNTLGGGQVNLGPLNLGGGGSGRVSWRELVN